MTQLFLSTSYENMCDYNGNARKSIGNIVKNNNRVSHFYNKFVDSQLCAVLSEAYRNYLKW